MTPFSADEKKKFLRIKDLVLGVVSRLDNQKKLNIKRYTDMFDVFEKNPDEFRKWISTMGTASDETIQIFALPFEEPSMQQIKAAADFEGIPLEEYIYYRQNNPNGVRSKMKVPVGYCTIKRMQQMLNTKNHYVYDTESTSLKTGQVKDESKCASLSDVEVFALKAINADNALKEFLGPRADNLQKKQQMYQEISQDGFCTLESLKSDKTSSVALNTLNTYLLASGVKSDLINNTLQTEYTINQDIRKK
jgi:hypothetical protein